MGNPAIEELRKRKAEIEAQLREAEEKDLAERREAVSEKIYGLSEEQKKVILSLLEHDRTTCSDENPCNGYFYSSERWRCRKCMLMEIFNHEHGGDFDFKICVEIEKVVL